MTPKTRGLRNVIYALLKSFIVERHGNSQQMAFQGQKVSRYQVFKDGEWGCRQTAHRGLAPLATGPHKLAERYRTRDDALDIDDADEAVTAASR